jgi:hypothetical protein
MKFENSSGGAIGARFAWHEAFSSDVSGIDIREIANSSGVQFSAKGGDGKTMDHCDKGKIQQIVHTIRCQNKNAWAWGMLAYAPEGSENISLLRNILLDFAFKAVQSEKFNPYLVSQCGSLAFIAIADATIEARTGTRHRRKRADMARLLKCSVDDYLKKWSPVFFKIKDALKDLDAIALPPVADVVWLIIDKANGDCAAEYDLREAMKTPAEAA